MIPVEIIEIEKLLKSEFHRGLFRASLDNLNNKSNKLRFNNFAYSIRELSRHILYTLAPDSKVLECTWYKNETQQANGISRGQRIKYAIQGGLEDDFVNRELIDIDDLNDLKKLIVQSIDTLSKYTHVNENTFDIPEKEVDSFSRQILDALREFAQVIYSTRQTIRSGLESNINEEFIQHVVSEYIDELDALATHHNVEGVSAEDIRIIGIESRSVLLEVDGYVDVRLQWGSNSDLRNDIGTEMETSFPFKSQLSAQINEELPNSTIKVLEFKVDTDEWYGED